MDLSEIAALASGGVLGLLALVKIVPIKWNPWTWLGKALGRAINGDVIEKLTKVEKDVQKTKETLDEHIRTDDRRATDGARQRILRFNDEVMRDVRHTEEHFVELLKDIDDYEAYCAAHAEYQNSRAVMAIANITRVYKERLEKNDFLK